MVTREGLKKLPVTSITTIMENFKTEVLGMLIFMDVQFGLCFWDTRFGCSRTKKGNLKLLLKYILRQFNSKDTEGSDDGGSS